MKLYTNDVVDKLAQDYIKAGGEVRILKDAVLASFGLAVMVADNKKSCIVREVYINGWSSGQAVKFYNKLPKKYKKIIDQY